MWLVILFLFFTYSHIFSQNYSYNIRIAAHIVRNDLGQYGISAADRDLSVQQVNNIYTLYNNTDIHFTIAYSDYIDDSYYTTGEKINFIPNGFTHQQKLADLFNEKNSHGVLHIYYIKGEFTTGGAGVSQNIPGYKIVVTNEDAINAETLAHEIGHCLGLLHTYETTKYNIQPYNNNSWSSGGTLNQPENVRRYPPEHDCYNADTNGDLLVGTPADPINNFDKLMSFVSETCTFTNTTVHDICDGFLYNNVIIDNMMSYPKKPFRNCTRNSFTEDQISRMKSFLNDRLKSINNTMAVQLANKFTGGIIPNSEINPSTLRVNGIDYNSGDDAYLIQDSYTGKTNQERFVNYQSNNIKHHDWNGDASEYQLAENFTPEVITPFRDANFNTMNYSKVEVKLEGILINDKGISEFQDPWYVLSNGSQPGNYWKQFNSYYEPTGKEGADEKGIFLNQTVSSGAYYSVRSSILQNIQLSQTGKYHNFYFQNWSWNGTDDLVQNNIVNGFYETPVVFREIDATVTANLKGTELSDNEDAYNNPGQRKFIKTTTFDGVNYINYYHSVYESMGNVWYERKVGDSGTWQIMNGGQPLSNGTASYPDICSGYSYLTNDFVVIAFNEISDSELKIVLTYFINGSLQYKNTVYSESEPPIPFLINLNSIPVIAYSNGNRIMVAWNVYDYPGFSGVYYKFGQLIGGGVYWYTPTPVVVSNTDSDSKNLTMEGDRAPYPAKIGFRLAWDQSMRNIRSVHLDATDDNADQIIENEGIVFSQAGFSQNYQPSVSVMPNNDFRISWFGYNNLAAEDGLKGSVPLFEKKVVTWFNYQFYVFGTNVSSHSMSVTDDGRSIIAYGDNDGASNKFRQIWYYTLDEGLGTIGKQTHLSNGSSMSNMYAMSFQNATLPHSFSMSANLGSLQKVTEIPIACGRKGIVIGDSAEFYFTLGDVTLNGNKIDFIRTGVNPDFSNLDTLNYYLSTEKFNVTNSSQFNFSIEYGVTDSLKAVEELGANEYVTFTLQLVNANNGRVIGEYTAISFTKQNIIPYYGESFSINAGGIGRKNVRVRFVVEENIGGEYAMANIHAEESVLPKQNQNVISYTGSEVVLEYALEQNYPNPFNPTTTISYQIPTSGNVTIKVYDILGNEVGNLVDSYKETGKYEVSFDASSLASGVYIYRLKVNDFVNVKKMLLLK